MILQSKLTPPTLSSSYVDRPRLYQELERWRSLRALLVRAPPGYGKSSLVSRWINMSGDRLPVAWLSLDASDDDPREFVRYLAAALEPFVTGASATVQPILADARSDPQRALRKLLSALQDALAADSAAHDRHLLLVLDDVHLLKSAAIDSLLLLLLERGPPQLHLCLLSRRPLSLPLARLYAQGQIYELTVDDLRFSADEVRRYLMRHGFARPDEDELAAIMLRSEGWITALQLATISQRERGHIGELLEHLHGDSRWLAEYLTDEVLSRQPPALRRFLLQTAILDSFNAPLCAAVTGVDDAYRMLAAIEHADLFLITLDERREWFRYHHVFQELLLRRLHESGSQTGLNLLHRRAAAWFAAADRIADAVRHLRAAGDDAAALELIAERMPAIILRDPYRAHQWFDLCPPQLLASHPQLMLDRCRLQSLFGNLQMATQVELTEAAIARGGQPEPETVALRARLQLYRAMASFYQSDIEATLRHVRQVQAGVPHLDTFERGALEFLQMHMCRHTGKHRDVQYHAARAMTMLDQAGYVGGLIAVRRELARNAFRTGNSSVANRHYKAIFTEQHTDWAFGSGELLTTYLDAAEHSYWQNDLPQAWAYLQQAELLAQRLQDDKMLAITAWYHALYTCVDPTQAPSNDEISKLPPMPATSNRHITVQIRLLMLSGHLEEAWQIAEHLGPQLDSNPADWANRVLLPFLRAYIARERDLTAVTRLLERSLAQRGTIGDRFAELQLLALKAWQQLLLNCGKEALATVTQATRLALDTDYVRAILDIPALIPLLDQNTDPAVTAQALRANRQPAWARIKLTAQQQAVLGLLAADYRYEQIADELLISINTVRTHVRHIYKKLGAHRRAQVIEQARVAGLIA